MLFILNIYCTFVILGLNIMITIWVKVQNFLNPELLKFKSKYFCYASKIETTLRVIIAA